MSKTGKKTHYHLNPLNFEINLGKLIKLLFNNQKIYSFS